MNKKVTLAYPLEVGGKKYKPDETVELEFNVARRLITEGRARAADEPAKKAEAK